MTFPQFSLAQKEKVLKILAVVRVNTQFKKGNNKGLKTEFKKGYIPWNKGKKAVQKYNTERNNKISKTIKKLILDGKWIRNYQKSPNKLELFFIGFIKKFNLPFLYTGNGKIWIENCNPDFVHKKKRIAIELFGDYFHNPILNKSLKYSQTEKGRKEIFARNNWKLIIFWEKDIKNIDKTELCNLITQQAV
jgi:hypothetical protein